MTGEAKAILKEAWKPALVLFVLFLAAIYLYADEYPLASEKDLKDQYRFYNMMYFDDELPHDIAIKYGECGKPGDIACTDFLNGAFKITLVKRMNPANILAYESLLHESCHIRTWGEKSHGKLWWGCMRRLFNQGALQGLL